MRNDWEQAKSAKAGSAICHPLSNKQRREAIDALKEHSKDVQKILKELSFTLEATRSKAKKDTLTNREMTLRCKHSLIDRFLVCDKRPLFCTWGNTRKCPMACCCCCLHVVDGKSQRQHPPPLCGHFLGALLLSSKVKNKTQRTRVPQYAQASVAFSSMVCSMRNRIDDRAVA